jgi:hypothetical protein
MYQLLTLVVLAAIILRLVKLHRGSDGPPEPSAGPIANAVIVDWVTMVCSVIGLLLYWIVFTNVRSLIVENPRHFGGPNASAVMYRQIEIVLLWIWCFSGGLLAWWARGAWKPGNSPASAIRLQAALTWSVGLFPVAQLLLLVLAPTLDLTDNPGAMTSYGLITACFELPVWIGAILLFLWLRLNLGSLRCNVPQGVADDFR